MVGASDYRGLRFEYLLTCQPDCKFYLVIFSSPFLFTNELIPSVLDSHLLHLHKRMLELQGTLTPSSLVSTPTYLRRQLCLQVSPMIREPPAHSQSNAASAFPSRHLSIFWLDASLTSNNGH